MTGQSRGRQAAAQRANGGNVPATTGNGGAVVADADQARAATVRSLFERMAPEMQRALPKHMTVERMIRVALTVVQEDEKLLRADPRSLLGALMTCTQVGLEPGPQGHVYFLPFWDSKANAYKVTFILGYRGIIELARRSGLLLSLSAHTVYANEVDGKNGGRFEVKYGTENTLIHHPVVFGERGEAVGYYATARLANPANPQRSEDVFVVLTRSEVDEYRKRSATQKAERPSGPWNTDYEAMSWKTCIRRLERWLPQSPELAAALAHEDTVREKLEGNVVDQSEPKPAEPFEVPAGGQPALMSPPEQRPDSRDEPPPSVDPKTGEVAEASPAPGERDGSAATSEPVVEDPPDGYADPELPEPGGPDDPWSTPPRDQ